MLCCSCPPAPGMNGAWTLPSDPVAEMSPRAFPFGTSLHTASGKRTVLVGIPVLGRVAPTTREYRQPMLAFRESALTMGWMLCPALLVWNERTMVSLLARRARRD